MRGRNIVGARGRLLRALSGLTAPAGLALALALLFGGRAGPPGDEGAIEEASVPLPAGWRRVVALVSRGQTLSDLFSEWGLLPTEVHQVVEAARGICDLGRLHVGDRLEAELDGARLLRLEYPVDIRRTLIIGRAQDAFTALLREEPCEEGLRRVGGRIQSSLAESLTPAEDGLALALSLAEIFAWSVDFEADLQPGDRYRALAEEVVCPGPRRELGRVLAAEIETSGKSHVAVYYRTAQGQGDYFDAQGRSLRRQFLRSPLPYRRISSGFSRHRLHPILRVFRPHLGVDYAAPTGTPVVAVAEGTVLEAGRHGGFGRLVRLRHPGEYETSYAHLSRIASGVRRGARLRQGQVLGYVGATGLATGPHLDFRLRRGGRYVNPLTATSLPAAEPVPAAERASFEAERDRLLALLGSGEESFALAARENSPLLDRIVAGE